MIINKNVIYKLNPCKDRFDNYVKHYGNRDFTPKQFMGLKNITHHDKMWVALRLVNKKQLPFIAADIAESVLHIFKFKYPNDGRRRKAIKAARSVGLYIDYGIYSYYDDAATADAAAAYTVAAYAAAAYAAGCEDVTYKVKQQKLNRTIILKYWMKKGK